MACEVADGLRLSLGKIYVVISAQFQWPVKWPMVCAAECRKWERVEEVGVSMACEVADGLRLQPKPKPQSVAVFQWPVKWPMVCARRS